LIILIECLGKIIMIKQKEIITISLIDDDEEVVIVDKINHCFELKLPKWNQVYRFPGIYPDRVSKHKFFNNHSILKAGQHYLKEVSAIVLDGKMIRTSTELLKMKSKLKKLTIIEVNRTTSRIISNKLMKIKSKTKKSVLNLHIIDFIEDIEFAKTISTTNLFYMDLMNNYFDSENSKGSQYVISTIFQFCESTEVIFAASFCLRNRNRGKSFSEDIKEIFSSLEGIFKTNKYNFHFLIPDDRVRYAGQKGAQMMFVLYYLHRQNELNEITISL
jgi:hypothetical protein